jgi:Xaa-Pro aminopeptidase
VNGTYSGLQRELYSLVLAAQQAGIDVVRPGVPFTAPHQAAMSVLAHGLEDLGLLPVSAEEALSLDSKVYARWTLHSTSHMLGIDVHDCAKLTPEQYIGQNLRPGHCLTVEPGLYFQVNDRTVPAELRGLAVRIEDDVVVTGGEPLVLSAALPTHPDDLTAWIRDTQATPGELESR